MSKLSNTSFIPGDVISTTAVNDKFADVHNASLNLNELNVRNEGIDRQNITSFGISTVFSSSYNNVLSSSAYTSQDGQLPFALTHGSGSVISFGTAGHAIADGDMLRLHYSVVLEKIDNSTSPSSFDDGDFVTFFPSWDITSNALTDYETIPDHADLLTDHGTGSFYIEIDDSSQRTDGYTVVPAYTSLTASTNWAVRTVHGSWAWENDTGSSQTVYGIQLNGRGVMSLAYTGSSQSWAYFKSGSYTEDIHVERTQMLAQVLSRGSL